MQYPTLLQLRAAEFPTTVEGEWVTISLAEGGEDTIFEPSVEGLIEACSEDFTEIRDLENLQRRAVHPIEIPADKKYEAVSSNGRRLKYGHGSNLKDALANLFLAIHNPTFGL